MDDLSAANRRYYLACIESLQKGLNRAVQSRDLAERRVRDLTLELERAQRELAEARSKGA